MNVRLLTSARKNLVLPFRRQTTTNYLWLIIKLTLNKHKWMNVKCEWMKSADSIEHVCDVMGQGAGGKVEKINSNDWQKFNIINSWQPHNRDSLEKLATFRHTILYVCTRVCQWNSIKPHMKANTAISFYSICLTSLRQTPHTIEKWSCHFEQYSMRQRNVICC